ncbi:MAG: TnpV protein [Schaedlerella sp.]|jgi:hypothetical protein|uniref:TnpV protein n=1 Tax=Mediterraneibacter gnavus TaxID=33038 RepID=UPI00034026A1|nr:TnpV protein [Mediterraneibacter gnavus]CDA99252.1 putative uncharacterized protein [Lachnospiraceae bacterium CAG:215]HBJ45661.1 TnpV protein [Ruminococcus sp.]MDB8698067.1 TnpV protein [Mediterraneibacter gnavus]RHE69469.1 TnpV protein [Mediterraneibacter gnavus]RHM35024.1 TnpV protein [Mediterraneibacter gnavus]
MNREKSIFEQMGGTYVQVGGYLLPSLGIATIEESRSIGKYGLLCKSYLKDYKPGWYQSMLLTGKLDKHLVDIDEQARERFERIIEQMKQVEQVTEELKAKDLLAWVQAMNSICNRADEIVRQQLIYN